MLTTNCKLKVEIAILRACEDLIISGERHLPAAGVLDTLVALETYLGRQLGEDLDPATVRRGIRTLLSNPQIGEFLVAWDQDSQIVGQIEVKKIFEVWDDAPYWYLDNYVVSPEFQGMGIGMAMMDHVKTMAQCEKVKRLRLYVAHHNPGAKAFYIRNGFSSQGDLMEFSFYRILKP